MYKIISLIILIAFPDFALTQSTDSLNNIETNVRGIHTFKYTIHPNLPIYVFHLIGDSEYNVITHIDISIGDNPTIVQSMDVNMEEQPYRGAVYFQIEDVNFDGYKDIKLLNWWGVTGNVNFSFWRFDNNNGKFIYDAELSDLTSPIFNPKTKLITTYETGGMAGMIHTGRKYKYQDNKLLLIEEENQIWIENEKQFLKTIRIMKNGAMRDSLKQIIVDDNWK